MGKASTISTAIKPEDVDKAYASAVKALSTLGIKMPTKKPDAKKLGEISKAKPATFQLVEDGSKLKLAVASANATNVLGIHDLQAEKDLKKAIATYKALIAMGHNYKAELAAAEKALKGGPDPKVLANIDRELEKSRKIVMESKKQIADLNKITNFAGVMKDAEAAKSVMAYAKKTANDDTFNCLLAIAKKQPSKKIIETFIKVGAPQEMNLDDGLRDAIVSGKKEPVAAYPVLDQLFAQNVVSKWRATRAQELKTAAAPYEKKITDLEEMKKKAKG